MLDNIFIQMHLAKIKELPPQIYNGLQLILVLKGSTLIYINNEEYVLNAGQLILVNCHDIYSFKGNESNVVLILKIPFEYLSKECEEILNHTFHCYSGDDFSAKIHKYNEIKRILVYMMFSYGSLEEGYRLNTRASLFQLLYYLLENFKENSRQEKTFLNSKKDRRISSILAYVDEYYKQHITLTMLAEKEFVSVPYLSKLFKKQLGMGFIDYINIKRLDSALKDLMYTNESILMIALQNGFANVNAFISLFKKQYKETPNKFKQNYQKKIKSTTNTQAGFELLSIDELGGLPELVNYIRLQDQDSHYWRKLDTASKTVVSLDQNHSTLAPFEKIINIGKCSEALKSETKNQLILTQEKLKCQYVLFQGVFCDGMFQSNDNTMYEYYDYNQIIAFFREINLTPFIQLNLSDLVPLYGEVSKAGNILALFLSKMVKYFPRSYIESWKFEITADQELSEQDYLMYYQEFYSRIKCFSQKISIGIISFQENNSFNESQKIKNKLLSFVKYDCIPHFITFKADPNHVINDLVGIDASSYQALKGYHLSLVTQLQEIISECNLPKLPLYMTEWNTLAGKGFLEAGSFYRSALMAEAMLDLSGHINGLAFWLSEYAKERVANVCKNNVLSLFHCHTAKRSTFFVLRAFSKLSTTVLFQNKNIIVTQNEQKDITVMVLNPCYFNPIHSMDYDFMRLQHKMLTIELKGIRKGLYSIKSFNFTMKFTFAINNRKVIHEIGSYQYNDEDVLDYVQNMASPEFSLFDEEIDENYILHSNLSSNAIALYIFKKLF